MVRDSHFTPHPEEHADSWHRHTLSEGMPQPEHASHVNVRGLLLAFVLTSVGVVGVVIVIILYYESTVLQARQQWVETTALATEANEYRAESLAEIDAVRAEAFDQVIADYREGGQR